MEKTASAKVMIIDDETDIRDYLMAVLEDNGYDACSPQKDENVLAAVSRENPDLIILDIMMPLQSGISIYKELRGTDVSRQTPVALISGLSTSKAMMSNELIDDIDYGRVPAPDGFIEKPMRLENFLTLVKDLTNIGA